MQPINRSSMCCGIAMADYPGKHANTLHFLSLQWFFPITAWNLASAAVASCICYLSIQNPSVWVQLCLCLNANSIRSIFLDQAFLLMKILLMSLAVGMDVSLPLLATLPLLHPPAASLLPLSTFLPPSQPPSLSPCLSLSFPASLPSIYVSTLFMSLNNFLLAAIDDDKVVKFLFHKARFWKVGNGESHSCILDSDSLVDFA